MKGWKARDLLKKPLPNREALEQIEREQKAQIAQSEEKERQEFIEYIYRHTGIKLVPEYIFHPERKWRMDFASLEHRFYIEIDGGVFTQGRHTRGQGFIEDQVKRNEAVVLGWKPLHIIPDQRKGNEIIEWIKRLTAA